MPKSFQLIILLCWIFYLFLLNSHRKLHFNSISILLLLYGIASFFSALVNQFMYNHNLLRFIASLNTSFLWILASILYSLYSSDKISLELVSKFMMRNLLIFSLLVTLFLFNNQFNFFPNMSFFGRSLYGYEWFDGGNTTRFYGFMEYANLMPTFFLICVPYLFYGKVDIKRFTILILSFAGVFLSNSRIGIIVCSVVLFLIGIYFITSRTKKREVAILIYLCCAAILLIIAIFYSKHLIEYIMLIINGRPGSTNTRKQIYVSSLDLVINNSVVLGMGVKELIGDYPLGSHSTFIGAFYRVGLIGLTIISSIFFTMIVKLYKAWKKRRNLFCFCSVVSFVGITMVLFFEDLDGANWLICIFFSSFSAIINLKKDKFEIN